MLRSLRVSLVVLGERLLVRQLRGVTADPLVFINEAWRVLAPGGFLFLTVPHWQSENAYTDPTHRRFCTVRTFDYWIAGTDLHAQMGAAYGPAVFTEASNVAQVDGDVHARLVKG